MTSDLYSNAFNFSSYQSGKVDPRTGQYSAMVRLVTLRPQGAVEARRDINLTFTMSRSTNDGYGIGWSLGMTEFDPASLHLRLATGERFLSSPLPSTGGTLSFRDKKLKNVEVKRTDDQTLTVHYLDGTTETLRRPTPSDPYKTVALTFENGEQFVYAYKPQGWLSSITHASSQTQCLTLTYQSSAISRVRTLASGGRWAEMAFTLNNGLVTKITVPYDSADQATSPGDPACFVYHYQDLGSKTYGISQIDNPMGGSELITYQTNGHTYYQGSYLPFVTRWEQVPAAGQPSIVRRYSYSSGANFTGYPFSSGFTAGTDNLYLIAGDYNYWCEEKLIDTDNGNTEIETTRTTFNKFHLVANEEKRRGTTTTTTTLLYNELPGKLFSEQPANLQVVKQITVTYEAAGSNDKRSEQTVIKTDDHGNVLSRTEPSGIRTEWSYYPVKGVQDECPAEPSGLFVRYRKQERVVAVAQAAGKAKADAARQTDFRYLLQPRVDGSGHFVQRASDTVSNGATSTCSYFNDVSRPWLHGRLQKLVTTLNGHATTTTFDLELAGAELTETRTILGHGQMQTSALRRVDLPTALLMEVKDEEGRMIRFTYDALGRITSETAAPDTPAQAIRRYAYQYAATSGKNPTPAQLRVTDAKGNQYVQQFDGLGRVISSAEITGESTRRPIGNTSYDTAGRKASETIHDRVDGVDLTLTTSYHYNDWNEVGRTTRPDGSIVLSERDYVRDTLTTGMKGLNTTITAYNKLGQIAHVIQVDSAGKPLTTLTRKYDGFGRCTSVTDVDGHATAFEYDAFDRVVGFTTKPADGTAARTVTAAYPAFTSAELMTQVTVDGVVLSTRVFDGIGRLTSDARAGMPATTFSYQAGAAAPSSKRSPRKVQLDYSYDPALTALTSVKGPQGAAHEYQYDPTTGRLLQSSNATATHAYAYDAYQRVVTDQLSIAGAESVTRYSYSPGGRLTQRESPTGTKETRHYDAHGRLVKIVDGPCTTALTYDAHGRQTATAATQSGVTLRTAWTFDEYGREQLRTFELDKKKIQSIRREYLSNGKLHRRVTCDGNDVTLSDEVFTYDAYSRLTCYTCAGSRFPRNTAGRQVVQQKFSYDACDHITQVVTQFHDGSSNTSTRTYDPQVPGRLVEIADTAPAAKHALQYDLAGNLIDDGHGQSFQYDELDQLSFSSRAGTYRYDAEGKLVEQSVANAKPLKLHYVADRVAGETQGSASIDYHRCDAQVLGRRLQPTNGAARDELNAVDVSGSVVMHPKAGAGVVYTPYGESGPPAVDQSTSLIERHRIAFNGERLDAMANLYHLGNGRRAYSPQLMMFLSPDPLAPFGGAGLGCYAYCKGDPINAVDPTGLLSTQTIVTGVLALVALVFAIGAFALALPTGGASVVGFLGFVGALSGLVGAELGAASAGLAAGDELLGWNTSGARSVLDKVSVVLGAVSLADGLGLGTYAAAAARTSARLGAEAERLLPGFSKIRWTGEGAMAYHVGDEHVTWLRSLVIASRIEQPHPYWNAFRAFGATGFGISGPPRIMAWAIGNTVVGGLVLGLGIWDLRRQGANGNGQTEVPRRSPDGAQNPRDANRPVIETYADSIESYHQHDEEIQQQIARIRGSFGSELYRGRA